MGWTKGKLQKGKRPYKRWGKTPRTIDTPRARMMSNPAKEEFGGSVLYRNHLPSHGKPYDDLPPTLTIYLTKYSSLHDDMVPPIVKILRDRNKQWQSETHRQGIDYWPYVTVLDGDQIKLFMFFRATQAYFIYHDKLKGTIHSSIIYNTELARALIQQKPISIKSFVWKLSHYTD